MLEGSKLHTDNMYSQIVRLSMIVLFYNSLHLSLIL